MKYWLVAFESLQYIRSYCNKNKWMRFDLVACNQLCTAFINHFNQHNVCNQTKIITNLFAGVHSRIHTVHQPVYATDDFVGRISCCCCYCYCCCFCCYCCVYAIPSIFDYWSAIINIVCIVYKIELGFNALKPIECAFYMRRKEITNKAR